MRLIDADLIREEIEPILEDIFKSYHFINFIEGQPTAYDVKKVVEQLEKLTHNGGKYDEGCRQCIAKQAIEIVKEGVK